MLSRPRSGAQTQAVDYHSTKRGSSRRTFAFPHPESFHDIALFLANNWEQIEAHYAFSKYSKSVPTRDGTGERAVRITPHQRLAVIIYKEMSPFRFIVKTDISRFYPSIYTHSIPWSIHGKPASKADRSPSSTTVPFNRLDELLRFGQDGQTIGLPVGPDSSRIIAEIVAVAVDRAFEAKSKDKHFALVRHVDDIWIGAASMSEAEAYLYSYRECLREFELDINELKTSIFESSKALEPMWPLSLKRMIREDFRRLNKEDKTRVLAEVFRLAQDGNDDGIVKYAIRRFDREQVWLLYWDVLESFLMRALINFPHTIDYVARAVSWNFRRHGLIDVNQWRTAILASLERNTNLGNDSEVCWLLWLMHELKMDIPRNLIDVLLARCGAFPIVMFCHMTPRIRRASPRRAALIERIGPAPFTGPYWLLAHEAVVNGWLSISELDQTGLSAFMKEVQAEKVSFYDRNARPRSIIEDEDGESEPYAIEDMAGRYDDDDDDEEDVDDDEEDVDSGGPLDGLFE